MARRTPPPPPDRRIRDLRGRVLEILLDHPDLTPEEVARLRCRDVLQHPQSGRLYCRVRDGQRRLGLCWLADHEAPVVLEYLEAIDGWGADLPLLEGRGGRQVTSCAVRQARKRRRHRRRVGSG